MRYGMQETPLHIHLNFSSSISHYRILTEFECAYLKNGISEYYLHAFPVELSWCGELGSQFLGPIPGPSDRPTYDRQKRSPFPLTERGQDSHSSVGNPGTAEWPFNGDWRNGRSRCATDNL